MSGIEVVPISLLGIGLFFNGLGTIGLHRMPDLYTRIHAATKCTTFGTIFISFSVIFIGFWNWTAQGDGKWLILSLHTIAAMMAVLITNPTGAHAIARAARRSGEKPLNAVIDALEEVNG